MLGEIAQTDGGPRSQPGDERDTDCDEDNDGHHFDKHKLADMYIAATLARSNSYYGAWALSTDAAELPIAAATARVSATEAFHLCSKENIQTHGGMGFTWEFDCHMFYRRSKLLSVNLGSLPRWKDRLITAVEQSNAKATA